jgi:hypothetical protein
MGIRRVFQYIMAVIGFGAIVGISMIMKPILDANDHIDRCSDETSGRYIFDDDLRAAACK